MKKIPLTVLVHEGPMARAYLSRLNKMGLKPTKAIVIIYKIHPTTKKEIGKWLPRKIKQSYLKKAQEILFNHWPKNISIKHPELFQNMSKKINETYLYSDEILSDIVKIKPYEYYVEGVEYILADSINDHHVKEALINQGNDIVLFTGGGILKHDLLTISGMRFLHIHPGFLPNVRGADGLLWSTLVRGCPGESCFYMNNGIDTGKLIKSEELSPIHFTLSADKRPDDKTLYRAIFSYYDPILRAEMLARVLEGCDLNTMQGKPQDLAEGNTYHFMHERIRKEALEKLFPHKE